MIFGGDAFVDLIGEISLMKDMTTTMDITMEQMDEEELEISTEEKLHLREDDEKVAATGSDEKPTPTASTEHLSGKSSGTSTPRRYLGQQAIMDKSDEEARMEAIGLSHEEKELRKKEKKKGLTKEQQERLAAFELERRKAREERIETLSRKLIDRLSVWTETDKRAAVTTAFQEKIRLEVENLKMESFGLEILHAIGTTYLQKATSFLKSQKFLGVSGFFSRLKDKGTLVKETWNTISSAIDAQMTIEEMARLEERGGEEWTDDKKAEYERKVTGKILAAAWRGSKFEIQSVLRDVCDKVLGDKSVKMDKRIERAHALILVGTIYQKVSLYTYLLIFQSVYDGVTERGPLNRLNATLKKKASIWLSNNSCTTLPQKRAKTKRRSEKKKRGQSSRVRLAWMSLRNHEMDVTRPISFSILWA